MRIFIDDLNLLRIESNTYIYQIELENNKVNWLKNENFNQFFITESPIELHTCETITINNDIYPVEIGTVTLSKAFDKRYRYDGKLGYDYQKEETSFYLFSPVAKQVYIALGDEMIEMHYREPIWTTTVQKDLEGVYYHYKIRLFDTFKDVIDPYAIGATTKGNVIIDWDKAVPIQKSPIQVKNNVDTVIYEGHIRDLSIDLDVESKGLFEGLTEESKLLKGSVLDYIKWLGMTHLQLLPVYDFEGVDEHNKDALYNWGYNPSQYFCVEGWFSKNPDDPYDRINGLRKVINKAHELKLGVNMDVVFNHVHNHKTFPYDDIVPGYFYRHDGAHHMTHASYLDNDIETRHYMVRKFIVDNLVHWVTYYQIDGFRFDLMGLLDIETMRLAEQTLKSIHPNMMLYGEGWNMPNEVEASNRSNMHNQALFPYFGHFNDGYRNTIKGELHGPGLGYAMGNKQLTIKAMDHIIGSPAMFTSPNQSINYVECHDNSTFYDKLYMTCGFANPEFEIYQDFANHLIAISQGVPFYHAGQELYRSKKGVENSYNSPDQINGIQWDLNLTSLKKLKNLLKLRKKFPLYRQSKYNHTISVIKVNHILIYKLENKNEILLHYIKNYFDLEKMPLNHGTLIFPSQKALSENDHIYIDKPGIYIVHIKK